MKLSFKRTDLVKVLSRCERSSGFLRINEREQVDKMIQLTD